jgi:hypothetical protein
VVINFVNIFHHPFAKTFFVDLRSKKEQKVVGSEKSCQGSQLFEILQEFVLPSVVTDSAKLSFGLIHSISLFKDSDHLLLGEIIGRGKAIPLQQN